MWWIVLICIAVSSILVLTIFLIIHFVVKDTHNKPFTYVPIDVRSKEFAGECGEEIANYHLRPLLKSDEHLLRNLLIPLNDGHKTEIDFVMITRKGLFCIEAKRWIGHILGDDSDEYWIQKYDDSRKANRQHRNPVKQNENHCDVLARFLEYRYNVDNVVMFVNLEDGSGINSDYVFTPKQFKQYYEELDDELNSNDIDAIKNRLIGCIASDDELKNHKEDLQKKYGDYA